jgi:ubiquinone/menaquinone biosynthesis C-methylase UbiE
VKSFGAVTARIYRLLNRNPVSNRTVVDLAELTPDDRALEVGCGPGAGLEAAANRIGADRVAAVDPSPTFVDMARKRVPGADVRVSGAEDVPFPDGSFTVIWSIASMHHWTDRDAGLATLTAKLATPGRLLLAERLLDKSGHGITREQTEEVVAQLKQLGFPDVRTIERPNKRKNIMVIQAAR